MRHILIIDGNPADNTLCSAIAQAFAQGAESGADVQVRSIALRRLRFDPILHAGYKGEQALEPDLLKAQAALTWAQHVVWVYPNWWGSMPALLKGFFDRVLTPGFAFRYRKNSPLWDKLLAGKTAELLVTMDTPGWYYRWVWHRPGHQQMRHTILGYCGIATTRISEFGPVHGATDERRAQWLKQAQALGRRCAAAS